MEKRSVQWHMTVGLPLLPGDDLPLPLEEEPDRGHSERYYLTSSASSRSPAPGCCWACEWLVCPVALESSSFFLLGFDIRRSLVIIVQAMRPHFIFLHRLRDCVDARTAKPPVAHSRSRTSGTVQHRT